MSRLRRKTRWLSLGMVIVMLLLTIMPSLALANKTANDHGSLLTQAVQAAGTSTYDRNSQAYLQRALDALEPLAQQSSGISAAAIAALRSDLPAAFFDVSRVHNPDSLERTRKLIQDTSSAWTSNKVSDPSALAALTDLLLEMRQAADAALTDARLIFEGQNDPPTLPGLDPRKWQPAQNGFRQAEKDMETAFKQAAKGNAMSTGEHFLLAWRKATQAMSDVGITFQPGRVTDLDGDGVPDQLELRLGGKPISHDTDGDGLTDRFEVLLGGATLLPADPDTDRDGVGDADEDSDRDGLTNRQEQSLGTDPLKPDSDDDRLSDGQEDTNGTDPLKADVDADGLSDPAELRVGTDPRNPDTDGDGTLDGQDVLTSTVEAAGALVTITGTGDVGSSLIIRPMTDVPAYQGMAGLASAVTQITADLPFTNARVELPVDLSKVPGGDTGNLRLMYFDDAAGEWRVVEGAQGFDPATGRFWAETTHFTAFAVFYIPNWDDFWTIESCGESGEAPQFIDVALVLDSSGSMSWNDPAGLRREGAKRLVRGLLEQDRAAVVDFDSTARLLQSMTSDKAVLEAAIDRIDSSGGTNIGAGVSIGLSQLEAAPPERGRIMVLLTDGVGSYSSGLTDRAVNSNVVIYTIGLGTDIDISLLQTIAARTGGTFYHVLNATDLPDVFERVGDEVGARDSDNDTLSNCEEVEGMPDVNGKLYYSDSKDVDSDGDGLPDNEEMGIPSGGQGQRSFQVESDPMSFDTDGDGLDDGAELANGTPRFVPDWDGDGLNDYQELLYVTEPNVVDTDGDTFSDAYEISHLSDGFDPLVPDERLTPEEWARDFAQGLAVGDACDTIFSLWTPCKGTIPFFLGQLSGGATSFIPVVGWIVGAVADLRDAIGNAVKGEWVGAGLSVIGVIPAIGDVGKIVGKIVDFVSKFGKLEPLVRAILRILPKLMGTAAVASTLSFAPSPGQIGAQQAAAMANSPVQITDIGDIAKQLVLEVMRRVNPTGFSDMARFGGDDFLTNLAKAGAKWEDLAQLFNRLEDSGLFSDYPRMKEFVETMIRNTPDNVLYGDSGRVLLDGRVTLNVKKAALNASDPNSLPGIRKHLQGALAEHRHTELVRAGENGVDDIIPVGHVNGNGPDRVLQAGNLVDVVEIKALGRAIGQSDIKTWLLKTVDENGDTIYQFNGTKLDKFLRREGTSIRQLLDSGKQLRYNLFTYDANPSLASDLAAIFTPGTRIPIKGFDAEEIVLDWTSHWDP